jgi:hypothetical protein
MNEDRNETYVTCPACHRFVLFYLAHARPSFHSVLAANVPLPPVPTWRTDDADHYALETRIFNREIPELVLGRCEVIKKIRRIQS